MSNHTECSVCDYKGEMVSKIYSKNGQLKFYRCPVCYSKYIYKRYHGSRFGDGIMYKVKSTIEINYIYLIMMVFGLLCAFSGFLYCFNRAVDSAAGVTIFFLVVGIVGTVKYLNSKERKQFIEYRIQKYRETGEVPS